MRSSDAAKKAEEERLAALEKEKAKATADNPITKFANGAGKFLSDLPINLVQGVQQTAGTVADVAVQAAAIPGIVGTPFDNSPQANLKRQAYAQSADEIRRRLQSLKDVKGQNIEGTSTVDEAALRVSKGTGSAQDVAAVAGKGLETGLGATMFANPTTLARGATSRQVAERAAKDALLFGGAGGTAQGLTTYGQTGDLGQAAQDAGQAALLSGITQGTLDVVGGSIGRIRSKGQPIVEVKKAKDLVSVEGAPDKTRVAEYKARIENGGVIEPITVVKDKSGKLTIEDGKHRYEAYKQAGIKDIPVIDITPVRKNAIQKMDEAVSLAGKKVADKFYATTPGQKIDQFITSAQTKLQNSAAPIYRQLDKLQTSGRLSENQVKNVKSLIQTSRFSAQTLANDFLRNDADAKALLAPVNGKSLGGKTQQQLSDYINAKNELNLIEIDKKRGAKVSPEREASFRKTVAELDSPELQARFDADVKLNRKLTDLLVEEGLVTPQQRDAWRKSNTEYIRVQRILDNQSEIRGSGTGGKVSRSSTIASQKRKGSTKKASDAFETVLDRTNRVWAEITSNRAANAYVDALTEAGAIGKPFREVAKVVQRQDLKEALALSRPLKSQLTRFEKSQLQYVRRIQNEIDKLNAAGLAESVARPIKDPNLAGKLADPGARLTKTELQSVLQNIVENTDTRLLKSIRSKIVKREPKLAKALDELQDIQSVLSGVNAERLNQFNELAKLADEKVRGRATIQRFKDGIKEVYETTPEIEAAAKGFGPVYMGTIGKVISAPVRFLQTTITGGLNPAWAAISIPRDFVEGFVLSRRAAQTHNPANVIASALESAGIKKTDDKLFQQFMAYERGSSSIIDLTKGAKDNARTIRELSRQSMPTFKRGIEVIKTPKDWYETIQNASKWNEFVSKYQNFRGNYNELIKEGLPQDEAMNIALYEARNATGNLLEKGDWTKALAAVYPYFNPSVQGGSTLMKAFRDHPVSTSAKILTGIQIPAMVATAWNMSDPRRAEAYLDISPDERERYTIMVLPGSEKTDGKWQVIKIPKAPGVGNFANPIERMMIGMYNEDPGNVEQTWQSLIKAFGSPIDPGSFNQAVGSAIPFQLKPVVEAAANFDFYSGKQIVPDWLKEQDPNEPYKQAFDNTSSTFKKIGQALGISPLIVQNFASDTTGEFGKNMVWLSDASQELAGLSDKGQVGGRSPVESVTRAYSGAYGGEKEKVAKEKLNTIFNEKNTISSDITDAIASSDYETASRLANDYNDRISQLESYLGENKRTVSLSDKQVAALKANRFPTVNGRLTEASIKARLKSLKDLNK